MLPIGDLPRAIEEGRSVQWLIGLYLVCSLRANIRGILGVALNYVERYNEICLLYSERRDHRGMKIHEYLRAGLDLGWFGGLDFEF